MSDSEQSNSDKIINRAAEPGQDESGLVSVIIPTYNREALVCRAIQSVLNQTYQNFEIIVVDDGSSDNSAKTVRTINDYRIKVFSQKNCGVSAARNKGIELATSDFIAFLDADDEWTPKFIETVLKLKDKFPQAGAYVTAYQVCDIDGRIHTSGFKAIPPAPWEGIIDNYFKSATLGDSIVSSSTVCVNKSTLAETGVFPLIKGLGQDQDLWARIAICFPIAFSWDIGAVIHREAQNRRGNYVFENVPVWETIEKYVMEKELDEEQLFYIREFIARKKIFASSRAILAGQPVRARNLLSNCPTKLYKSQRAYWHLWAYMPPFLTKAALYIKRKLCGRRKWKRN
ncbi:MAG: glycosyltransferase family 2 protein [Planctomycetota bacterium]|jgi:glycosyltransferase involved in cell wall biosynthesis